MNQISWMVAAGTAVTCQIAVADLPDIFDRIPTDAAMVMVMPGFDQFSEALESIKSFAGEGAIDLGELEAFLSDVQGLDKDRAAAMFFTAGADLEAVEPDMIALVPVADYAAFVGQFGGAAGAGISEFEIEGEPAYAKSLGGGYAAMSPKRDILEAYEAVNGAEAAHEKRLGALASKAANGADLFVAADLSVFAEQIQQGLDEYAESMADMAAMGGQDMGAQVAMVNALGERIMTDGQIGFLAMDVSEAGMSAGFGLQFKDGSDTAGYLEDAGNVSRLTSRLPAKDLLFAYGVDLNTPGLQKINKALGGMAAGGVPGADKMMEGATGFSMIMGATPGGLMSGTLFGATSMYVESKEPKQQLAAVRSHLEGLNGQVVEGTEFQTSYQEGASEAEGASLDAWTVRLKLDQNMGQQAMIGINMLFGPAGGPGGYAAATKNGFIATLAKSSTLAGEAVKAANTGEGLGASLKEVSGHLPEGRFAEMYVGVGNILDMAMMFMAMTPVGPIDLEIPEGLPPVGFGVASNAGGVEVRGFAPQGVLKVVGELTAAVQDAQGAPPPGGPRF